MRVLPNLSQPAMAYMEGKFNDIMRGDSTVRFSISVEVIKHVDKDGSYANMHNTCIPFHHFSHKVHSFVFSKAEVGIVCQQEMERLKKEKAGPEERNPTRINLKVTI